MKGKSKTTAHLETIIRSQNKTILTLIAERNEMVYNPDSEYGKEIRKFVEEKFPLKKPAEGKMEVV